MNKSDFNFANETKPVKAVARWRKGYLKVILPKYKIKEIDEKSFKARQASKVETTPFFLQQIKKNLSSRSST